MPTVKNKLHHDSDTSDSDSEVATLEVPEEEEEEANDNEEQSEEEEESGQSHVVWTGYGKRVPVIVFRADAVLTKNPEAKLIGEKYHLAYKIVKTESKLVRSILGAHGFHEVHPNSNDFNVQWTGSHLKPYVLRGLQEFQKVNHFPRSYEITRKDRLYKNIQRMQQTKGFRNFDFVPQSFIIPGEFQDFCSAFLKDKGPWIVKPIASSRGRGIFLVNHPEQVPLDETMIVSRYISNPLTIDGFKFDIRLYVAVTSYDPLIIYLYEEGLTRFATVRYEKTNSSMRNQCMHLTNYSVNKKSNDYVKNDDPDIEDYGNKWSLGAMLRYLRSQGKDTTAIMMRVEDVIIKTLISAELPIATACKMFMPYRGNCFELYGFDVLIDEMLRPWVLEVNLSPSLACDSPLDLKIKSNMMSDLFSLTGLICHDPMVRKLQQSKRNQDTLLRPPTRTQKHRPQSATSNGGFTRGSGSGPGGNLTGEEIRIVRRAREEYQRRGGWVRIFPSPDSWELYGSYLQYSSTHNVMLYQQLFPERARNISLKPSTASYSSGLARTRSVHLHSAAYPQLHVSTQPGPNGKPDDALAHAIQRTLQYERKLTCLGQRKKKAKTKQPPPSAVAPVNNAKQQGKFKGVLVQGIAEESKPSEPKYNNENSSKTEPQKCMMNGGKKQEGQRRSESQGSETQSSDTQGSDSRQSQVSEGHRVDKEKGVEVVRQTREEVKKPVHQHKQQQQQTQQQHPTYNVVKLLEKGKTMSKLQARFAFAAYLLRVQQRLMLESSEKDLEDVDGANEQMDLVLRFLKRAAGNLQQPFKVVVPSRKLAINDRRRILAKQLGDFVHIYSKETEQLRQRHLLEKKVVTKRPPTFTQNDGLDEEKFTKFVDMASESELEEVLTTYTKLNKSASIFLGSNSKSMTSGQTSAPPSTTSNQTDTCLAKRKQTTDNSPTVKCEVTTVPGRPSSSYATAVSIYSTKLGGTVNGSVRTRPVSANMHRNQATCHYKVRPMSANSRPTSALRGRQEQPDGSECQPSHLDNESINSALHRLAVRQQQRQYAASRGSIILPNKRKTFPQVLMDNPSLDKMDPSTDSVICNLDDDKDSGDSGTDLTVPRSSSEQMWRSAGETFNSFVTDVYTNGCLEKAYSRVTGVNPLSGSNYHPTPGSTQFHIVQSQMALHNGSHDQDIMDQNHVLLDRSKLKHQSMIATAHANRQAGGSTSQNGILPPRPPPKPASEKRPTSQHRLARTQITDDCDGSQFYNSVKYDSNIGAAKPVFSSHFSNGV